MVVNQGVARLTLNRPRKHNRFEPADIASTCKALQSLSPRSDVRVFLVTACGPSFSSGFDLETLSGPRANECTRQFAEMCDLIEALPMPTLCGLNGDVYGGATDLALACDIRIGAVGCKLQMSPARLGVQYYYSGLRRYVERLGVTEAKRLFMTSEQVDTPKLLQNGFLSEACPADRLEARLAEIIRGLSQRSPASVRGLKRSLDAIARGTADAGAIDEAFFQSLTSPDAQEGLAAWSQKRPAAFADA